VITPPIIGSRKDNRGWNHNATAAALCPLRYREEFDANPLYVCANKFISAHLTILHSAFRQKVESGQIVIRAKDLPSFLYPQGSVYNRDGVANGLFRGHIFLRVCTIY
jgi:hypothetical protein